MLNRLQLLKKINITIQTENNKKLEVRYGNQNWCSIYRSNKKRKPEVWMGGKK